MTVSAQRTHFLELALGPVFFLAALVLAARFSAPWDLFLLASSGLFLIARFQMRGCAYALIALTVGGLLHHLLFFEHPFWHLGLQFSCALSFFLFAFSLEQQTGLVEALQAQLQAKEASVRHIEAERSEETTAATTRQIALEEKIGTLQREKEEVEQEQRSLTVLNEVLRNAFACQVDREKEGEKALLEAKQTIETLKSELTPLRQEKERLSHLEKEGKALLHELNQARVAAEQMRLINEALVRLHAKEMIRVKRAEEESSHLKEKIPPLLHTEDLYRQLKTQFEEKDRLLHETRSQLFRLETEHLALKMDKGQREESFSWEGEVELEEKEQEIALLYKENNELLDLISVLSTPAPQEPSQPRSKSPSKPTAKLTPLKKKKASEGKGKLESALLQRVIVKPERASTFKLGLPPTKQTEKQEGLDPDQELLFDIEGVPEGNKHGDN